MEAGTQVRWWPCSCTDRDAHALVSRHYSRRHYRDGRRRVPRFVGPGSPLVLITADSAAVMVWRKFIDDCAFGGGVNCAVFRNEGPHRSSDLIREADELAWDKWPGERHYTYVDPTKVRSTNPGYCFLMAGWRKCGVTQGGLIVMERMVAA